MTSKVPEIEKLGATNYTTWAQDVLAWLATQQLKKLVLGKLIKPSPADPSSITETEQSAIDAWEDKAEKAAGWIITLIKSDQRVHIKGLEDDPVEMWKKLEKFILLNKLVLDLTAMTTFSALERRKMNPWYLLLPGLMELCRISKASDQMASPLHS
jgi:hypothetical protein